MKKNSRIVIIGDSISTFKGSAPAGWRVYYDDVIASETGVLSVDDTWWKLLGKKLCASEVRSYSYSGSMIEGKGFPAACSGERIQAVVDDDFNPDTFIIFMGINDYGWGGSLNQAKGGSEAKSYMVEESFSDTESFLSDESSLADFESAYTQLIKNINDNFAEAEVFCCSLLPTYISGIDIDTFTYNLRGISLFDYNKVIDSACKNSASATYLDLLGYSLAYETLDGTHPTSLGMQQIAELIKCAISGESPTDLLGFHNSEPVCKDVCANCEYAYSTTKKWHCVCTRNSTQAKNIVDDYMQKITK